MNPESNPHRRSRKPRRSKVEAESLDRAAVPVSCDQGGFDLGGWITTARPLDQGRGWLWWTRLSRESASFFEVPPSKHRLVLCPFHADAATHLLRTSIWDDGSIWIVPTPAARDHWRNRFTLDRARGLVRPRPDRVWDFAELWEHIGQALPKPPGRLGEVAALALIDECLQTARQRQLLKLVPQDIDLRGYRWLLRDQFRLWTLSERRSAPRSDQSRTTSSSPATPLSEFDQTAEEDAFTLFQLYRRWLETNRFEDAAGWVVWASHGLEHHPQVVRLRLEPETVAVIDPPAHGPVIRRLLTFFRDHTRRLELVLPDDPEPTLSEPYRPWNALKQQVRAWRFVENRVDPPADRPEGLAHLNATLFRLDEHHLPRHDQNQGVQILGAPSGEAQGLVAAREALRLHQQGIPWNQMLFLTRSWDEASDEWSRDLNACGVPLRSLRRKTLSEKPFIRSLLRIIRLVAHDWPTGEVVACLRDRLIAPTETVFEPDERDAQAAFQELPSPRFSWLDRALAADAVARTRLPGGLEALRVGLTRMTQAATGEPSDASRAATASPPRNLDQNDRFGRVRKARHAQIALRVLNWLAARLAPLNAPRTRPAHLDALEEVAKALDLTQHTDHLHDWSRFRLALEEDELIVRIDAEARGQSPPSESWSDFANRAEQIARDVRFEPGSETRWNSDQSDQATLMTLEQARGLKAKVVIMANLGRGAFPSHRAAEALLANPFGGSAAGESELDAIAIDDESSVTDWFPTQETDNLAFAHEMAAFLRVVGTATHHLVLIYPKADLSGHPLQAAAFVEEVCRRFESNLFPDPISRLDAVKEPNLCLTRSDRLVAAVGHALRGEVDDLRRLARDPGFLEALTGTSRALESNQARWHDHEFGPYDGMICSEPLRRWIAHTFAPEHWVFSPTQLESYLLCPFQFFARYVLGLITVENSDELEPDYTESGRTIHAVLEHVHKIHPEPLRLATPTQSWKHALERELEREVRHRLEKHDPPIHPVEAGLRRIYAERLVRQCRRYLNQLEDYLARAGRGVRFEKVEAKFGERNIDGTLINPLILGKASERVVLQGTIDRIDVKREPDKPTLSFRVLDYKSGHVPSLKEVREQGAVQLPLYALAVERLGLLGTPAEVEDFGYWDVRRDGWRAIKVSDWGALRDSLEQFVLEAVARLRQGEFPVASRDPQCTAFCEYRNLCRIQQVRLRDKRWSRVPQLVWPKADTTIKTNSDSHSNSTNPQGSEDDLQGRLDS